VLGFVLALAVVSGYAQTTLIKQGSPMSTATSGQVPLCDSDAIDSTFTFRDQPRGGQTVSLYFRNEGNTMCRLKDPPNPSFSVDAHSMTVPSCPFCDLDGKPAPLRDRQPKNEVVLAPGASAAIDMNWASTGESCQWADWADIFFNWTEGGDPRKFTAFLFIPSGWPMHICSPVRSSGYRTAADSPFSGQNKPALQVSLLQQTLYQDEHAILHVELANPTPSSAQAFGCASLYTVRHAEPSLTRLDPLRTEGRSQVASYTPEQIREDKERAWPEWKKDLQRDCDIPAGTLTADAEIPASDLATVTHLEWQTAPVPKKDSIFFTAPTHFTVLDLDTLEPNWGETVQGIRAGLSVDRAKVAVGETVRLHLRWQNVSAAESLGQSECREPRPKLEIQNSRHQVLKTIPTAMVCSGHGWGPYVIDQGTAQSEFRQLPAGTLPSSNIFGLIAPALLGPGVYYLVTVWSPLVLDTSDAARNKFPKAAGKLRDIYATARSLPVRIEIAPGNQP
jgi:hypothetical protein